MQLIKKYTTCFSVIIAACTLLFSSCKKFLDPEFKTQVEASEVFANDNNANAALLGLYSSVANQNTAFNGSITQTTSFASDELTYFTNDVNTDQFIDNQIQPGNSVLLKMWNEIYFNIFQANAIIEGSVASAGMTTGFKTQTIGEAKFIRAFCYFYLVNVFGDVPLVKATSKDSTALKPRTPKADIYTQIISDLKDAYNSLPADFSLSNGKRNRANKWAAAALLSRVYLYVNDFSAAETTASEVIANGSLYSLRSTLNEVYLKNKSESILEIERLSFNTFEGDLFTFYFQYLGFGDHLIRSQLNSGFEPGDKRKTNWIKSTLFGPIPYKYKSPATNEENYVVLRLAEIFLIRAEARAQLSKFPEAQSDLNQLRIRAGIPSLTTVVDKPSALLAVEKERKAELFCEFGHRWFDLRRWPSLSTPGKTRADDILATLKGAANWQSTDIYFPIPQESINKNPFLTQNSGY